MTHEQPYRAESRDESPEVKSITQRLRELDFALDHTATEMLRAAHELTRDSI